jgi:hypothetical protein
MQRLQQGPSTSSQRGREVPVLRQRQGNSYYSSSRKGSVEVDNGPKAGKGSKKKPR